MSSGTKVAKPYDVFFVGFCLIMSGIPSMWNIGLGYGFWEFFMCAMLMSATYLCLCLCLAEMTSILPFSGGSYGFARVSMGPYIGFVIGCFDSMSNTFYACLLVQCVCLSIVDFVGDGIPAHSEPVLWLLMYIVCLSIMIGLGRWSFTFISFLGVVMLCTCVGYVLSTANQMNFEQFVLKRDTNRLFDGHMSQFMFCLPIANWLFLGPDMMCLVCDDTENAKNVVPRAIMACMVVTILITMAIVVAVSAQAPGFVELASHPFPLNPGFSAAFGVSEHFSSILMLPIAFAGLYCLTYIAGRQMCAMARSRLLPYAFTFTTRDNSPFVALIASALMGYGVLLVTYLTLPNYVEVLNWVYLASLMCTISCYLVSCICFILFRVRYTSLERCYENKLGIGSAVFAIAVFSVSFVGSAGYSQDGGLAVKVYFGFLGVITVYYIAFARNRQTFSPEEKAVLLRAYVLKANSKHRTFYTWAQRKIRRVSISASSSPTNRQVAAGDELEFLPQIGGVVLNEKPASSVEKDKQDRERDYSPTNEGVTAGVDGLTLTQSHQHSLVLFDVEQDESTADGEYTRDDPLVERRTKVVIITDKEELMRKDGWISGAMRSLNGSYRVAPAPSE